jgi:cytochrome c2
MNHMKKKNNSFRKASLLSFLFLIAIFAAIQLYHPEIIDTTPTAEFQAPPKVKSIITRACYDCHSNETDLRWYDKIAPVYWQVVAHVKAGREGLNFSTWGKMPAADQKAKLWEAVNQIQAEAMPLKSYAFIHPSAKISAADLVILKAYLLSIAPKNTPDDTIKINALNAEVNNSKNLQGHVPAAMNGVPYFPDYKNWEMISTTERFDNGTMRVIFGNDIAVKAIRQNNIRPWPKGAVLAKADWDQLEDKAGLIRTGAFKQVEFMIKDDDKYASTKGWGFARFKTTKLVPYGKTALFATECINCHRPQKDEDFVFTKPIKY